MHADMLGNVQIVQGIVQYALAQTRHELLPSSTALPPRPVGVGDDPTFAYTVAGPEVS